MSDFCTATTFASSRIGFPPLGRPSSIARGAEDAVAQALDVVGRCARIAWWDGSALGLRLDGFMGLFEAVERESDDGHREPLR